MTHVSRIGCVVLTAVALAGCGRFGLTSRVLHRVSSPDGKLVAVCQEIPVPDGPDYDVRLERNDGSVVARLFHLGDGDPCSELAWSPDGRVLGVLTAHAARIHFADVGRALAERPAPARWFWPQISFGREGEFTRGSKLRFVTPAEFEVVTCPYDLRETQRDPAHQMRCTAAETPRRARVPL